MAEFTTYHGNQVPEKKSHLKFPQVQVDDNVVNKNVYYDNSNVQTLRYLDLNLFKIFGKFSIGNDIINTPTGVHTGIIEIYTSAHIVYQKITEFVTGNIFTRKFTDKWSDWVSNDIEIEDIDGGSF